MAPLSLRPAASAAKFTFKRPSPFAAVATRKPRPKAPTLPRGLAKHLFVHVAEGELSRGHGKERKIWLAEIEVRHLRKIIKRLGIAKRLEAECLEELAKRAVFAISVVDLTQEKIKEMSWSACVAGLPVEKIARWVVEVPGPGGDALPELQTMRRKGFFRGAYIVRMKIELGSAGPEELGLDREAKEEISGLINWVKALRPKIGAWVYSGEPPSPSVLADGGRRKGSEMVVEQLLADVHRRREYVCFLGEKVSKFLQ